MNQLEQLDARIESSKRQLEDACIIAKQQDGQVPFDGVAISELSEILAGLLSLRADTKKSY